MDFEEVSIVEETAIDLTDAKLLLSFAKEWLNLPPLKDGSWTEAQKSIAAHKLYFENENMLCLLQTIENKIKSCADRLNNLAASNQ